MNVVRVACWAVGAGILLLAPGRPAAADAPPDEAPFAQTVETPSLEGTTWEGVDCPQQIHVMYRFEKDGVLTFTYQRTMYHNGTWRQSGKKVYFETFHRCRECEGVVRGDLLLGDSWNAGGATWSTVLHKSPPP